MSLAQKLRDEGRRIGEQEGRKIGEQEGRRIGEQEGRRQALRDAMDRLLRSRFGSISAPVLAILDDASLPELEGWFDRILTGATVEDVFGRP